MENSKNYLDDIKGIKELMDKSTQFISLSGLSGVLAGVYALIGGYYVHYLMLHHSSRYVLIESLLFKKIVATAAIVLIGSIVTAYIFTANKTKKEGIKIWTTTSKRLVINFLIPLITGGIFSLLLLGQGVFGLIAPITLIFYGLACVNASKYTFRDVRYLGLTQIILGLISVEFSGYGLYFWILGFGVCHILYGSIMYFKYDRK
jgi:hypothetical protein